MNWRDIATASMILFAVIDIVGSIPLLLSIEKKSGKILPLKTTTVALVLMVSFLFGGESILGLIGIDVNSFAVAGSIVLFFMGLEMVMGLEFFKPNPDMEASGASIVPVAFPIIAGAGSMTTLVSLRAEFSVYTILIAIALNMIVVFIVLKASKRIEKILGKGGVAVLEKVFGIILLSIAVKLFSTNISSLFANG